MRKLLMIGAAVAALSAATATPALARDAGLVVGGTAGAWTGGTIGFLLGGPIGAVIGGSTGAAIGASVLSDDIDFRDDVRLRSDLDADVDVIVDFRVGDFVSEDVELRFIDGEDRFGYFRSAGQIYIVDLDTREIVEIRLG